MKQLSYLQEKYSCNPFRQPCFHCFSNKSSIFNEISIEQGSYLYHFKGRIFLTCQRKSRIVCFCFEFLLLYTELAIQPTVVGWIAVTEANVISTSLNGNFVQSLKNFVVAEITMCSSSFIIGLNIASLSRGFGKNFANKYKPNQR